MVTVSKELSLRRADPFPAMFRSEKSFPTLTQRDELAHFRQTK